MIISLPGIYNEAREVQEDILEERQRQISKWGAQSHSFPEWLVILQEEVGEACQAYRRMSDCPTTETRKALDAELVQCAAVAAAMLQCLRKGVA